MRENDERMAAGDRGRDDKTGIGKFIKFGKNSKFGTIGKPGIINYLINTCQIWQSW